jgi:hypothetical protein
LCAAHSNSAKHSPAHKRVFAAHLTQSSAREVRHKTPRAQRALRRLAPYAARRLAAARCRLQHEQPRPTIKTCSSTAAVAEAWRVPARQLLALPAGGGGRGASARPQRVQARAQATRNTFPAEHCLQASTAYKRRLDARPVKSFCGAARAVHADAAQTCRPAPAQHHASCIMAYSGGPLWGCSAVSGGEAGAHAPCQTQGRTQAARDRAQCC